MRGRVVQGAGVDGIKIRTRYNFEVLVKRELYGNVCYAKEAG